MLVEVRFGLAKVEITWVESTLQSTVQGDFDSNKTTPWDTVFGLIVRCLPGPNKDFPCFSSLI